MAKQQKVCYYCGAVVSDEEWADVMEVTDFWVGLSGLTGMEDLSDIFVHMTGALAENLDENGNVVVCSRDAIREMKESLANVE